jgi:uncharacterized protein YcaQ
LRTEGLSNREARWLAIAAQGLDRPRRTKPAASQVLPIVRQLGTVQLDAINVLERTQFIALFSRLGDYATDWLHDVCGPGRGLFEYWGHAASLLPVEYQPLFRWRMARYADGNTAHEMWRRAWGETNADYIDAILREVREHGPMPASRLTDPRPNQGEWWDRRSSGRVAMEWLFTRGDLAAWRSPNFERIYDVPERVIPAEVLARPTPPVEDAQRQLLLHATAAVGVGTVGDLADYFRIKPADARHRVAELVDAGLLRTVTVEGWTQPGYCLPSAKPRRPTRPDATVLSPFDSLIWARERTQRIFGFDYRIEVYVPAPKRKYGYYVLPVLLGDQLVGRVDLKADRKTSTLLVQSAFADQNFDVGALAAELHRIRAWLRLENVAVGRRGALTSPLRAALRPG